MTAICERCGRDVITRWAGATPVLRHAVPPADPHYPKLVDAPKSEHQAVNPLTSSTAPDARSPWRPTLTEAAADQ